MARGPRRETAEATLRVLVWSDDRDGTALTPEARRIHPDGIARTLADLLGAELREGMEIGTAGLDEKEQGLAPDRLAGADVLLWWGHEAHEEVEDAVAERVRAAVESGLGLVALHSAHHSKPFRALMGTSCDLSWREARDEELIWTVAPGHEIAAGIANPIELGRHEMYGEPFEIAVPDELVFISSFSGGEVFRSGCCFRRGTGRIFYFSPGHETNPVFANPAVRRVIANAVRWAAAGAGPRRPRSPARESAPIWGER
jgi:trehalose utilization protein